MQDLFTEIEPHSSAKKSETALKITFSGKQLSKKQKAFNKLVKSIEAHSQKIKDEEVKLDILLKEYSETIPSLKKAHAESNLKLAKGLASASVKLKFGKKQKEKIRQAIVWLCNDAFGEIKPDEESIAFYDM